MLGYRVPVLRARIARAIAAALAMVMTAFVVTLQATAEPTVIGVNGTTVNLPIERIEEALGVKIFESALDFNKGALRNLGYKVVKADYPASFGILTLGGPEYDKSVAIGKASTIGLIKEAQNGDSSVPVIVSCYSQGADVCSQANAQLWSEGYDQTKVTYFLLGNVDAAAGGLKVRIPDLGKNGIYIPGPGVTLGNTPPTTASDAQIIQVSFEYDGFARAPRYPINLLAVANAIVGTALYHGVYSKADPYAPGNIVSTTPDGKITNIVIPAKEVPLLTLAKYLGMPQKVVDIINPALKAIIDTGYDKIPEGEGAYPTKAEKFRLLPSTEKMAADIKDVQQGFAESADRLQEALKPPAPESSVTNEVPDLSGPQDTSSSVMASRSETADKPSIKEEQPEAAEQPKDSQSESLKPKWNQREKPSRMTDGDLTAEAEESDGDNGDSKPGKRFRTGMKKVRDAVTDTVASVANPQNERDEKQETDDTGADNDPPSNDSPNNDSPGGESDDS